MYNFSQVIGFSGEVLKIDHTFWITKFVRDPDGNQYYQAMMTVMNEYAEVLAFYFCTSKSLNELRSEFELLAKRHGGSQRVKVVYSDNAMADSAFLKDIFGSTTQVKRDIFHVFNDFYKMCYKHPLRSWFMGDIKRCFFSSDIGDKNALIERILMEEDSGFTREELEKKDETWFKSRVRRYIVNKVMIKELLESVFQRYSSFKGLFKRNMHRKHASILKQLEDDLLTDPEEDCVYFDVSQDSNTQKFITLRGTSQLESLHYHIQEILNGPNCCEETVHYALTDRLYRWNQRKAASNRSQKGDAAYNPMLQNEITCLHASIIAEQGVRYHIAATEHVESFGILRYRFASESFISCQAASARLTCGALPDMLQKKGLLRDFGAVSHQDEKSLYYALSPLVKSPAEMVAMWNDMLIDALLDGKPSIDVVCTTSDIAVKIPILHIRLKDERHILMFEKESRQLREVVAQFCSVDSFTSFRNTRVPAQYIATTIQARKPSPLQSPTLRASQSTSLSTSAVICVQAKRRKAVKPCPQCSCVTRRHVSKASDIQNCALFALYQQKKAANSIVRQHGESLFDAVARQFYSNSNETS